MSFKKLQPYTNTTYFKKEKVLYLNKEGRSLIGSDKEVKQGGHLEHTLLRNEAYIFLNKPYDWEMEKVLEYSIQQPNKIEIVMKGVSVANKSRLVADALYTRNGYTHLVEIDNKADMKDNHKKIKSYVECFKSLNTPKLEIFTLTENRKRTFEKWLSDYKLRGEIWTYSELS